MTVAAPRHDPLSTRPPALRRPDGVTLFIVGALMTFGIVMVTSASVSTRVWEQTAATGWTERWQAPLRQILFSVLGFAAMAVTAQLDYRQLRWQRDSDFWRPALVWSIALVALIAMYTPGLGRTALGAQRAVVLVPGLLSFQPAEVAKLAIVIWLAALLSSPVFDIRKLAYGFGLTVATTGILVGLVTIEDFGTGALLGTVMVLLLAFGRARWWHVALLVVFGGLAAVGAIAMRSYRLERLITYFSAAPDPAGAGYQINQALLAIGSGGWFGRGLGQGVQKYDYLPQGNNDFILAILCEELGIVGALVVIMLFLLLLIRGGLLAARAGDPFGKLLAIGLTLTITLQAAFNVGVVTNSIPTKGISLPFVSAGGSGVVFLGIAAGLLASVARHAAPRAADAVNHPRLTHP